MEISKNANTVRKNNRWIQKLANNISNRHLKVAADKIVIMHQQPVARIRTLQKKPTNQTSPLKAGENKVVWTGAD